MGLGGYEDWQEFGSYEDEDEYDNSSFESEPAAASYSGPGNDRRNPNVATLSWNEAALEQLLMGAGYGVMGNHLDALRDKANSEAITDGAEYGSAVHLPGSAHANKYGVGGFVYTKNYQARIDEAYHSTLLHLLGQAEGVIRAGQTSPRVTLPPGVRELRMSNGQTRYHGIHPVTGNKGFVPNPFR